MTMGKSTKLRRALLQLACIHSTASAFHTPSIMPMPSPHRRGCRRHSRGIIGRTTTSSSSEDGPSSSSSTTKSPSFDGEAFEANRLLEDARAMDEMRMAAEAEYSMLRTPWKWRIRRAIWDHMEENDIARYPRPVHHRIPNFDGADDAANRLATLPEFRDANIVKVNPDTPQRRVRHHVLEGGKTLLTPQPRLRTGFFSTLKRGSDGIPHDMPVDALTTSKGAAEHGTPVSLYEKYNVDLVVVGSSAVCPKTGARVGKGEGFAELEWGILTEMGNLDPRRVMVVTTVHDCQVYDGGIGEPWRGLMEAQERRLRDDGPDNNDDDGTNSETPFGSLTEHDVPVDIIVTPTRIIRVPEGTRLGKPSGVYWNLLSPQKLAQIRVLRELKGRREEELGSALPSGPEEVLPPTADRKRRGGGGRGRRGGGRGRGQGRNGRGPPGGS
jgi:5-formyltetrahydrofolate cyclo-ligase